MNSVWSVVKTIGAGLLASNPAGLAVLGAVNAFLPDDEQLPSNATGEQARRAIESLPPEERVKLQNKKIDLAITEIKEENETLRNMLNNDAKNPHSTRPKIAYGSFLLVGAVTLITVFMWAYSIASGKTDMTKVIVEGWVFPAVLIAPFVAWLNSYFGTLRKEARDRLNAASGDTDNSGVAGLIGSIARMSK
ncbi:MAG: hypothetical protein GY774_04965 [Planctomycetes bacterium]|nr:hypothetical protein [Planctomycetota bacterium]